MATTPGGRQIAHFGNDALILPSGGMTTVKKSSQGQVTIEDGKLCVFVDGAWNSVGLTPIPETSPAPDSDLTVSGAGTTVVNGEYKCLDENNWSSLGDVFAVKRITGYPAPDATVWALCQGANVLYTAPNSPSPWEGTWEKSSFGTDPAPTVAAVVGPMVAKGKAPVAKQPEAKK